MHSPLLKLRLDGGDLPLELLDLPGEPRVLALLPLHASLKQVHVGLRRDEIGKHVVQLIRGVLALLAQGAPLQLVAQDSALGVDVP